MDTRDGERGRSFIAYHGLQTDYKVMPDFQNSMALDGRSAMAGSLQSLHRDCDGIQTSFSACNTYPDEATVSRLLTYGGIMKGPLPLRTLSTSSTEKSSDILADV